MRFTQTCRSGQLRRTQRRGIITRVAAFALTARKGDANTRSTRRIRMHVQRLMACAALGLAIAAAAPELRAQEVSRKLTPMDVFTLQVPAEPQISPDGKKIAYVRRFADPMTDRRYANLWIINADGGDHRAISTGNRSDAS